MAVQRKTSITKDISTRLLFPAASMHGEIESDKAWRVVAGPSWTAPAPVEPFCAVDFESYYDKAFSLDNMSPWEYISHAAFSATLVALERYDGRNWSRWVGKPEDAPFAEVAHFEWWSHNANFDELVYKKLAADGIVKVRHPEIWNCTSDLAAHLQLDRGLDRCAPLLIGEKADKSVREKMRGGMAGAQESKDYAGTDSRQCAWIRHAHGHRWPELERFLSRLMRRAGYRGVYADQDLMTRAKAAMTALMRKIEKEIPWSNTGSVTGNGIFHACDRLGIPRPFSVSLEDKETSLWQARHDKHGWLEKIRDYTKARQINSHISMMMERTRKDGTIPFELIYAKAPHTKRWQSGSGLRMQNLDADAFNDFHVRHFISVPPQQLLISADSSQIEPRVLNWWVGDQVFIDACKKGSSPYDAHARSTMGWTGGDLKKLSKLETTAAALYALAKARVLALGYQAGPPKFVEMARTMAGLTVFETEVSWSPDLKTFYRASEIKDRIARGDLAGWVSFPSAVDAVQDFRSKSKLIVDRWYSAEDDLRASDGRDHIVVLPNGSQIVYFDVLVGPETIHNGRPRKGELSAWVVKNSRDPRNRKYLYGGKIVENWVQRVAREGLAYWKYRAAKELGPYGLRVVWSVHDELNCYTPKSEAKALNEALLEIMHTSPPWAPDLPVAAESQILDHYVK